MSLFHRTPGKGGSPFHPGTVTLNDPRAVVLVEGAVAAFLRIDIPVRLAGRFGENGAGALAEEYGREHGVWVEPSCVGLDLLLTVDYECDEVTVHEVMPQTPFTRVLAAATTRAFADTN